MQCVEIPYGKQRLIDKMDVLLEKQSKTYDPRLLESQRKKVKNLRTAIREYDRRH